MYSIGGGAWLTIKIHKCKCSPRYCSCTCNIQVTDVSYQTLKYNHTVQPGSICKANNENILTVPGRSQIYSNPLVQFSTVLLIYCQYSGNLFN